MIYIDSSSLLKLIVSEPESEAVQVQVFEESLVIVSPLAELEAEVQLKGWSHSGRYTAGFYSKLRTKMHRMLSDEPMSRPSVSGGVFQRALGQHRLAKIHCRSLDRLHLAAMEELGIKRLMTHDSRQADAARERGISVSMPGVK